MCVFMFRAAALLRLRQLPWAQPVRPHAGSGGSLSSTLSSTLDGRLLGLEIPNSHGSVDGKTT